MLYPKAGVRGEELIEGCSGLKGGGLGEECRGGDAGVLELVVEGAERERETALQRSRDLMARSRRLRWGRRWRW